MPTDPKADIYVTINSVPNLPAGSFGEIVTLTDGAGAPAHNHTAKTGTTVSFQIKAGSGSPRDFLFIADNPGDFDQGGSGGTAWHDPQNRCTAIFSASGSLTIKVKAAPSGGATSYNAYYTIAGVVNAPTEASKGSRLPRWKRPVGGKGPVRPQSFLNKATIVVTT